MPTTSQVLAGAAVGLVAGVAATRRRRPDPAPPAGPRCRSCPATQAQLAHYRERSDTLAAELYGPRPEPAGAGRLQADRFQWAAR